MQAPHTAAVTPAPVERHWTPRRVILFTLAVVAVIAGFYLLYRFSNVLFVVFIAAVLATAMRPAVLWLERRHIPQWLGVVLIYTTLIGLTVGIGVGLAPLLADQGGQIFEDVPGYYTTLRESFTESNSQILRRIGRNLPTEFSINMLGGTTQQQTPEAGDEQSVVSQAFGYVRWFTWGLFGFVAVFLIAYFWTLDHDQIVRACLLIVAIDKRPAARELWDEVEVKVGGYVRGEALLMLSIGILSAIAFVIIGVPSALVLALIAGLLEAVQIVGPLISGVIAAVVTLASEPDKVWWVLGACLLIQQLENAVLVPRIMGRTVGVNPLVTLLAIAAFGSLLGLMGAVLAIPLAAIIQVLLERWLLQREAQPLPPIEGRDKTAVVRYLASDLSQDLRERIRTKSSDQDQSDDTLEEEMEALLGDIDELLERVSKPAVASTVSAPPGGLV